MQPDSNPIFSKQIMLTSALMIISGTASLFLYKAQANMGFKHTITQTVQMFLGEYLSIFFLVIPFYFTVVRKQSAVSSGTIAVKSAGKSSSVRWYRLGFGGLLDSFGSTMGITALILMPPSVSMMMGNGNIIFTAIFTVTYLKRKLQAHHWIGVGIIMVGFLVVGLTSILYDENPHASTDSIAIQLLGIVLMLISLVFQGFQGVYEEGIMLDADVDPKRFVAAEGVFGVLTLTLLLLATAHIPCYSDKICEVGMGLDNPAAAMMEILGNAKLLLYTLGTIVCIMTLNITGMTLTKQVSALFKLIIGSIGTIVVWVISVLLGFEKIQTASLLMQLLGFALLILGTMIYNEVIFVRKGELAVADPIMEKLEA